MPRHAGTNDLAEADQAWLDELGLALMRRDDVSGATGGRLLSEQREAVRALRADEAADGREPESLDEAFGRPDLVVTALLEQNPDEDALGAEERQAAGLLAQCSAVAVMVGLYLLLIWPFQHLLGHGAGSAEGFGVGRLMLFLGMVALAGGFWSTVRSWGLGDRGVAALGAVTAVAGGGAIWAAHLVKEPEGPWWLGVVVGAVLVVAGWRCLDSGAVSPRPGGMTPERWYQVLRLRLALVHTLPRSERERLVAGAREVAGDDPVAELGPVSVWARRAVDSDPRASRLSHRNTAVGWFVLLLVALGFVAVSVAGDAGSWTVIVWSCFAVLFLSQGLGEARASRANTSEAGTS